jgi:hypothetical protein
MKKKLLLLTTLFFFALASSATVAPIGDLNDEQSLKIKLSQNYPNPAVGKTFINVEFESPQATLRVYNVLGKLVVDRIIVSKRITLDVTTFTEGIYFYTLEADGEKITRRMTVEKH